MRTAFYAPRVWASGSSRLMLALLLLVAPLSISSSVSASSAEAARDKTLPLPGESFQLDGHEAFVILPPNAKTDIPWVWYAPTLPRLPGKHEKWMFERFLKAGIAIAGIDVGESYGSPAGRKIYTALYDELVGKRGFRKQASMLARSRGGLMLYCWAVENPEKVRCIAGIYPVCNISSYPGLEKACGAYGLTAEQLCLQLEQHNPVSRLAALAKAKVPIHHIHGDKDGTVPLDANSALVAERYKALGGKMTLEIVKGQGHNMWQGWFTSQALVDFIIASNAVPKPNPGKSAESQAATDDSKKLKLPGLVIDLAAGCTDVAASVCLDEGLLELVACTRGTKEHESIVAITARPMHVHAALLLLGALPGNPAMRKRVGGEQGRWIDIPPKGDLIDVFLVFEDEKGERVERPISEFIKRSGAGLVGQSEGRELGADVQFPTHSFLFAGSQLSTNSAGPRDYLSDLSGNVISISTFGDELLCLPDVYGHENESLMWGIDVSKLPPIGSQITLRLRPQKRPTSSAAKADRPAPRKR